MSKKTKQHPKNCTCKMCKKVMKMKKTKKVVKEGNLQEFINQIVQKNYSVANKYLQSEINSRIKAKISNIL